MTRKSTVAGAAVILAVGGLILWRSSRTESAENAPAGTMEAVEEAIRARESPNGPRPKMDIVFALDTTGSMRDLLEGAKKKIWEIARRAQQGQPAPELRVGLVAYRDIGEAYVTKVLDLTPDLDKVYATLSDFRAEGGGDDPEHVIRGLHDAVHASWSDDANAVKLVYLVGDAPPHYDYQDGLTMEGVLADAKEHGIHISAIRCGGKPNTLVAWQRVADVTGGEVATIQQSGGVVAISTPYDRQLAELNEKLARTEVHWGTAEEQKRADEDVAKNLAAPAAVQADRAQFYAHSPMPATKNDLAAAPTTTVPVAQLPPVLRDKTPEERAAYLEGKRKEREAVLAQIRSLSEKRDDAIRAAPRAPATAFDTKVMDSLERAGSEKGISYARH